MTYIEPFVGGGAVLFWILQEYPNITKAIINDINEELICTNRVIKSDVENLILELTRIQTEYLALDNVERKNYFLFQRNRFNEKNNSDVKTAALLIFLNRTCFNGLYRVNSKGKFNVPYGKYTNPKICDEETLRADSAILQRVEVLCGDFAEQMRLCNFCEQIAKHKSLFVASNSDPQNVDNEDYFFDHLYKRFSIKRVSAARMINSKGSGRGTISEIMISNVANVY